jgi:hypothetical protein
MKKVLILTTLLMTVASSSFATQVFTAAAEKIYGGVDATAAASAPTPLAKFSTGVNGGVVYSNNTGYLIATKHTSGSKMFGSTNTVNNIYWKQATAGVLAAPMLAITTPSADNFVGNGWTSY